MVWYVALVAILNIGVGYALAVYLRAKAPRRRASDFDFDSSARGSTAYGSDDTYYAEGAYESELENSVS